MILSGETLRKYCHRILSPYRDEYTKDGLSGGLSVAGYDISLEFDSQGEIEEQLLYPGQFMLASTVEYFQMPNDILGVVHDKSTLARKGLAVQNTVIEPRWCGYLTLELTNHSALPIHLRRGQPIAQVLFHRTTDPATYSGKYQNQERGPQQARK